MHDAGSCEPRAVAVTVSYAERLAYWGQALRHARAARGWTQAEVVALVNARHLPQRVLSRQTLGDMEQGSIRHSNVRLDVFWTLLEVLEMDLSVLLLHPTTDLGKLALYLLGQPPARTTALYAFVSDPPSFRHRRVPAVGQ